MLYITLNEIKKHLNIDEEFTDDDMYLQSLIDTAEQVIEKHIDNNLGYVVEEEGVLPLPLIHAMKLWVGDMYASRESVSYGATPSQIPHSFEYLLGLYKSYI